jgi:hypothetical protein
MKGRRLLIVAVLTLSLLLSVFGIANAITYGEPDGDEHPYVGIALFPLGGGWFRVCSGTLLNPTVFLTAGHCTDGFDDQEVALVTFKDSPLYSLSSDFVLGTPHTHPEFNWFETWPFPNNYDVGVVVLSEAVEMEEYGELPDIGAVDELKALPGPPQILTVVGYGTNGILPNPHDEEWYLTRYNAEPQLIKDNSSVAADAYMRLSSNPGKGGGTGGTCFGDSGGPALFNDNTVAAVTSAGNKWCNGPGLYYRVDTHYAQNFINQYLP